MEPPRLIEELVLAQEEPQVEKKSPKRNSKQELIDKIISLSQDVNEPVLESDSQLKRMNKGQLTEKLASLVEKRIEFEATKVLGIDKEQAGNPFLVNLAALRMFHDIACNSVERLVDRTSKSHGMTLEGFTKNMRESRESVDLILSEIAQTYPDVLEKFSSPWTRLSLLWCSNVMVTLKKKEIIKKDAPVVRFAKNHRVHPV
jgi:hypothetical protein